jgi:hypothetical protein
MTEHALPTSPTGSRAALRSQLSRLLAFARTPR